MHSRFIDVMVSATYSTAGIGLKLKVFSTKSSQFIPQHNRHSQKFIKKNKQMRFAVINNCNLMVKQSTQTVSTEHRQMPAQFTTVN